MLWIIPMQKFRSDFTGSNLHMSTMYSLQNTCIKDTGQSGSSTFLLISWQYLGDEH